ncbi:MAG TPA: hypothetical protein VIL09_15925 [Microvirga sp.]|jgi:hypothetical protein
MSLKAILASALVVAGFGLGAAGAQAQAVRVDLTVGAPVYNVQFWDDEYEEEYAPVYRPRYRVYRERPVEYYQPGPVYRQPSPYGRPSYYNKEAAKDYVKDYRRSQKEIVKERARAWNRQNGF